LRVCSRHSVRLLCHTRRESVDHPSHQIYTHVSPQSRHLHLSICQTAAGVLKCQERERKHSRARQRDDNVVAQEGGAGGRRGGGGGGAWRGEGLPGHQRRSRPHTFQCGRLVARLEMGLL